MRHDLAWRSAIQVRGVVLAVAARRIGALLILAGVSQKREVRNNPVFGNSLHIGMAILAGRVGARGLNGADSRGFTNQLLKVVSYITMSSTCGTESADEN
jgi:hypothetical protein